MPASLKFYLTSIAYLSLGIIIGTGLFLNWSNVLYIKVPLEVYIHANSGALCRSYSQVCSWISFRGSPATHLGEKIQPPTSIGA